MVGITAGEVLSKGQYDQQNEVMKIVLGEKKKIIHNLEKELAKSKKDFANKTLENEKIGAQNLEEADKKQNDKKEQLKNMEQHTMKILFEKSADKSRKIKEQHEQESGELEIERRASMVDGSKRVSEARKSTETLRQSGHKEEIHMTSLSDKLLTSHQEKAKELVLLQIQMEDENRKQTTNHLNGLTSIKLINEQTIGILKTADMQMECTRLNERLLNEIATEIDCIVRLYQMIRAKLEHAIKVGSPDMIIRQRRVVERMVSEIESKLFTLKCDIESFKDRRIDDQDDERKRICTDLLSILIHLTGDCEALKASINGPINILGENLEQLHNNIGSVINLKISMPEIRKPKPIEDIFKERTDLLLTLDFKTSQVRSPLAFDRGNMICNGNNGSTDIVAVPVVFEKNEL